MGVSEGEMVAAVRAVASVNERATATLLTGGVDAHVAITIPRADTGESTTESHEETSCARRYVRMHAHVNRKA